MKRVENITYLGDKVSSDGRNTVNVRDRVQKGVGLTQQIMKIIQQTGFGTATVEIALVLGESLLINGMMTNSEIWHNITASEIEEFERVDRLFFQQLMGVPQSVPKPVLFLEFGALPLNYLVKARRLNYLYNLLNSPNTSMLFKVFSVQWHYPSKGDWTLLVKDDLRDFELPSDLQKLKLMSKENFKKQLKKEQSYVLIEI